MIPAQRQSFIGKWFRGVAIRKYLVIGLTYGLTALIAIMASSTFPGVAELGNFLSANLGTLVELIATIVVAGISIFL